MQMFQLQACRLTVLVRAFGGFSRSLHTNALILHQIRSWSNLSKWPTWRTNSLFYNKFIRVLYMFWAMSCSSSGGQILLIQHLLSSRSVSECPLHLCTERPPAESDNNRYCINKIWPPDDEHDVAQNMQRTVTNLL
jgi:hypothetical protein